MCLPLQRAFTLRKALWDSVDVERVKSCSDPAASADLAAVLITVGFDVFCFGLIWQCTQPDHAALTPVGRFRVEIWVLLRFG